ncbi:MAG: tetratricopeptide repeat protein [Myxococcota bacterium]
MLAHRTLASLLFFSLGCATYSEEAGKKLEAQVYGLDTKVSAIQAALKEAQDKQKLQADQIADVTKRVDAMQSVSFKSAADFGVQLDSAMQEVARLKGVAEGSKERLDAIESQLARVADEAKLAEDRRTQAAASEEQKKAAAAEAAQRERILNDASALVDEVVRLLNAQKPNDARKLLREFSQRAETNERLKRDMDNVQFLIAETYFLEGNYQLAATEYNTVRKNYPKSEKIPESLYKMGQCFERLKLPEDAKLFYKTLVDKYPKADAAKRAKERLKDLK